MCVCKIGSDRYRLLKICCCFCQISLSLQNFCKIIAGICIVRADLYHLLKMCCCFCRLSLVCQGNPYVVVSFDMVLINLQSLLKMCNGIFYVSPGQQDTSDIVMCADIIRIDTQSFAMMCKRRFRSSLFCQRKSQSVISKGVVFSGVCHALKERDAVAPIPCLQPCHSHKDRNGDCCCHGEKCCFVTPSCKEVGNPPGDNDKNTDERDICPTVSQSRPVAGLHQSDDRHKRSEIPQPPCDKIRLMSQFQDHQNRHAYQKHSRSCCLICRQRFRKGIIGCQIHRADHLP